MASLHVKLLGEFEIRDGSGAHAGFTVLGYLCCQRDVERLTIELVDYRSAAALHDARYVDLCGSEFEVHLEIDRQEQCLAKFRACGPEDGEKIAQGGASLAGDNRLKRDPLSVIRTRVDNDLALAVSRRDFEFIYAEIGLGPIGFVMSENSSRNPAMNAADS